MDDKETLNRRARLRELVASCFDGKDTNLLDHIETRTGKRPNQGEISGLQKDHGPRPFGDKKAKNLTDQVGLQRYWFDLPLGSNLDRDQWEYGLLVMDEAHPVYAVAEGDIRFNVDQVPKMAAPVPLISWVQAGDWCGVVDNFAPGDADEWLPCPKAHGPNTFALRVRGVSMEPKYRDGAVIFVDPARQADHLSNVVVRLENDKEATFKQLVVEGEKRFLRPLNPDWPGPKLMEINESATICGVVIGQFIED